MNSRTGGRWGDAAKLGLLCLVLTPVTIFIHELGHFLIAMFSEHPATLHPTRVSGGAALGSGSASWKVALQAGGGPFLTIVMSLVGAMVYKRKKHLWALALALAAASRLAVTTAYLGMRLLLFALGRPFGGTPNFDEHVVARALGFTPEYAAIAASLFLLGLIWWLFKRVERRRRLPYFLAAAAAIVAGNWLLASFEPATLVTSPGRS